MLKNYFEKASATNRGSSTASTCDLQRLRHFEQMAGGSFNYSLFPKIWEEKHIFSLNITGLEELREEVGNSQTLVGATNVSVIWNETLLDNISPHVEFNVFLSFYLPQIGGSKVPEYDLFLRKCQN